VDSIGFHKIPRVPQDSTGFHRIPGFRAFPLERPTILRWIQKLLKDIDSDSPDDEESESIIRIYGAFSSAKLRGLQSRTYCKE
jgi:hypothetical protein